MLSNQLSAVLSPFSILGNRHALAPLYRSIELSPTGMRGCSSFALLEYDIPIGINATVCVDGAALLGIAKSLPDQHEIQFDVQNSVLHWTCGNARGRLATVTVTNLPSIDIESVLNTLDVGELPVDERVLTALELGAMSCDSTTIGMAGMTGVVLDNTENLVVYSTDNHTISAYDIGQHINNMPAITTLPALGVRLFESIATAGCLYTTANNCMFLSADFSIRALVRPIQSLKMDVRGTYLKHRDATSFVSIPPDRIKAFINRAISLTENRQKATVSVIIEQGNLTLAFDETGATTDESYPLVGLPGFPDMPTVSLPATKIARTLGYADKIALDYLDSGTLLFVGDAFTYLIGGRVDQT